jgi:selenocysteine-specific elongation factor
LVDEAILPGDTVQVQLRLEQPILTFRGDRIILRDFSAQHTVGGGEVLNPFAPKHKRFTSETTAILVQWEEADNADIVNIVLENSKTLCVPESYLHYYLPHSQQSVKTILDNLEADGKITRWDKSGRTPLVSDGLRTTRTKEKILNALADFHAAQPLLPGQNATQLQSKVELDETGFEKLENQLIAERQLAKDGNLLRLTSHEIQFSQEEETAKETLEKLFLEAGIHTPTLNELNTLLPEHTPKVLESTFFALLRLGQFVRIADDFFIHKVALEKVQELLITYLRENDIITVAEFREIAETSRKYAVPFLEYCDSQNITIRDGNVRRLHSRYLQT